MTHFAPGTLGVAIALLHQLEGTELHPYQDQGGVWTIGTGFTNWGGLPVSADTPPITMAENDAELALEVQEVINNLEDVVTVALTIGQGAALVSFDWNEGHTALAGSTLMRDLNRGLTSEAAAQFAVWNKVREHGKLVVSAGLVRRRSIERNVFNGTFLPHVAPTPAAQAPVADV